MTKFKSKEERQEEVNDLKSQLSQLTVEMTEFETLEILECLEKFMITGKFCSRFINLSLCAMRCRIYLSPSRDAVTSLIICV